MGKSISFWMRKQANIFFIKGAREKVFGIFKWVASHQRHIQEGNHVVLETIYVTVLRMNNRMNSFQLLPSKTYEWGVFPFQNS